MAWDVSIISTFKEVIAGINWLDAPAGILLFGADSDFKNQVHEKFLNNIIGIVEIAVSNLPRADSMGTASAPNASALNTSVPERIPPSTKILDKDMKIIKIATVPNASGVSNRARISVTRKCIKRTPIRSMKRHAIPLAI